MQYARPQICSRTSAMNATQHAQDKGWTAIVDCIMFPLIIFATPLAYEADW